MSIGANSRTKQAREQLNKQVAEYLNTGGKVEQVEITNYKKVTLSIRQKKTLKTARGLK